MPRDYRLQIEDILSAIARITAYVGQMGIEEFAADSRTQDAVVRNLEIIGEAVRSLPASVRDMAPTIDWRRIVALRNILIHEYFGVSIPIIWDVTTNKLPELQRACIRILESLSRQEL